MASKTWLCCLSLAVLAAGCKGKEEAPPAPAAVAEPPAATAPAFEPAPDKTADDVLAAYLAAIGGAEKLAKIESLRMIGTISGRSPEPIPVTVEKKRPNRYRRIVADPAGENRTGYDGATAWKSAASERGVQVETLPADVLPRVKRSADIDGPLVDLAAKGIKAELLGKGKVGDADAFVLKLTFDDGQEVTYYLDAATGLPIKSVEPQPGGQGTSEVLYRDYRDAGGVLWSFEQEFNPGGGAPVQTFRWTRVEANPALDDASFAMPQK